LVLLRLTRTDTCITTPTQAQFEHAKKGDLVTSIGGGSSGGIPGMPGRPVEEEPGKSSAVESMDKKHGAEPPPAESVYLLDGEGCSFQIPIEKVVRG